MATLCFLALIIQKATHPVSLDLLSLAAYIFQLHLILPSKAAACAAGRPWEEYKPTACRRTGSAGWPAQVAAVMAAREANSSWQNQAHGWLEFNLVVIQVGGALDWRIADLGGRLWLEK